MRKAWLFQEAISIDGSLKSIYLNNWCRHSGLHVTLHRCLGNVMHSASVALSRLIPSFGYSEIFISLIIICRTPLIEMNGFTILHTLWRHLLVLISSILMSLLVNMRQPCYNHFRRLDENRCFYYGQITLWWSSFAFFLWFTVLYDGSHLFIFLFFFLIFKCRDLHR